jgi:hypothetical protein
MNPYFIDLDIGQDYILNDKDYFDNLDISDLPAAHFYLPTEEITDEFKNWVDQQGLFIRYSEIFYSAPRSGIHLHSDEVDPPNCCKINWIYDQGETWMNWYIPKAGVELTKHDNSIGGLYWDCDRDQCDLMFSARVGRPSLLNVSVLHDIKNPTDHPRWCISIVLQEKSADKRLEFHRALEIFKPYFKNV